MVGDAVLFRNREIKPSIELRGLPEEVGKVTSGVCLFQACVVINPVTNDNAFHLQACCLRGVLCIAY